MATLPFDVLLDVLDSCYFAPNHIPDYPTLRALSLVYPPLTRPAQSLLFRTVFLWRDSLACAFGAAVNPATKKGQWLARRVRVLRVIVRPSAARGRGLSQPAFLAAVCACPELREVEMDPRGAFDLASVSAMRAHPPSFEALRFHIKEMQHFSLIGMFPNLKYLQVKEAGPSWIQMDSQPPICALRELHWRGDASAAEWVLRGSIGTLEILTLETPVTSHSAIVRILETHGHSLRSLCVRNFDSDLIPMLKCYCTRLEEFSYNAYPTPALLAALPPTLEHLQFSGVAGRDPAAKQDLFNFIRAAPSLLSITYTEAHWASDDPVLLRWLTETCETNLIVFFYIAPHFGSFPGERFEFGPVSSFPRPLTLSPLRLRESPPERDPTSPRTPSPLSESVSTIEYPRSL